ncbi:hypothetical protein GCM10025874_00980 [Arenivirga flava]|uniref:Uncharacterized protein n=1 Tax=Arenivirga flava TaxID=1930060 RepID=A0AA37UAF4_9MICO|nr:hypothetical protein GCM10025874_00980 [Arenivirga flava]
MVACMRIALRSATSPTAGRSPAASAARRSARSTALESIQAGKNGEVRTVSRIAARLETCLGPPSTTATIMVASMPGASTGSAKELSSSVPACHCAKPG